MKLTIEKLLMSKDAVQEVLGMKMNMEKAFALAEFVENANDKLKIFETLRTKVAEKYSNATEEEKTVLNKEIEELLNVETDIEFPVFDKTEFAGEKISVASVMQLKGLGLIK